MTLAGLPSSVETLKHETPKPFSTRLSARMRTASGTLFPVSHAGVELCWHLLAGGCTVSPAEWVVGQEVVEATLTHTPRVLTLNSYNRGGDPVFGSKLPYHNTCIVATIRGLAFGDYPRIPR